MPQFGQAHKLLSTRHRDTIPPADGADPSDGQIPTWSDALGAWAAADPPPAGVTAHGLLTGLLLDHHTQYALLSGRSGGQTLKGSVDASEHLTLQSTAHATRGYVRAQDDLQLLSNIIRDSGGNARLTLATATPHVAVTGDLDVSGRIEVGGVPYGISAPVVNAGENMSDVVAVGLYGYAGGIAASGVQLVYGLTGGAEGKGTPAVNYVYGLLFQAIHSTSGVCLALGGQQLALVSAAAGSGAISEARGLYIVAASWTGSKPTTVYGLDVLDQGNAAAGTAYGLHLADQTATTVRLQELGPSTPYLRLIGGADPAAKETNFFLKEEGTLRQAKTLTTREVFLPVRPYMFTVRGDWFYMSISSSGQVGFVWKVPPDFVSLNSVNVLMLPDATETIQADIDVSVSAVGETHDNDTRQSLNAQLAVTINVITEWDIGGIGTLFDNIDADDYVAIRFQSDTSSECILGCRISYEASRLVHLV